LDWKEELYQLLIGHLSDAPFDDGVREIGDIAAYYPEEHERYLGAIQGARDAALTGDEQVIEVINRGNARYVADLPSAIAFLNELRSAYLTHYQQELERARSRRR